MKDLDFDELDKAVNTLMAGVPNSAAPPAETPEKTLDLSSTLPNETPPQAAAPSPSPSLSPAPDPALPPASRSSAPVAPASRRSGRFMDVVHTPSAMKSETRPVSRHAATIEPSPEASEEVVAEPSVPTVPPATSESSSESSAPKADSTETIAPKSDWPDPLEMANFSPAEKPESKPAQDALPKEPEVKESKEPESPPAPEAPLTTPFLPDTKVEKRPLGANATLPKEDTPPSEPVKDFPTLTNDDQLPATADDVKPLLPEELHSDLVAIESDTTEPELPTLETELTTSETETEAKDAAIPPKKEKPTQAKSEKESAKPESPISGPTSIPQQYREEPASDDQKSGAIYDTSAYHQPLAHPAKQKSGWMWVVWIVLILLVGAGAGAALYFLGIL